MKTIFREKLQIEKTEKGFHINTESYFDKYDLKGLIELLKIYLKIAECEVELRSFIEHDNLDF